MVDGQELIAALPSDLTELISTIAFGFKILLGVVGIYFVFWIINMFLNYKKNKILKEILVNLKEINGKLSKGKGK